MIKIASFLLIFSNLADNLTQFFDFLDLVRVRIRLKLEEIVIGRIVDAAVWVDVLVFCMRYYIN